MSDSQLRDDVLRHLALTLATTEDRATNFEWRMALSHAIRDRVAETWLQTGQSAGNTGKRVYYLSMEFLIGRLLGDAMTNLGLADEAKAVFDGLGLDYSTIVTGEPDAALGNGGLGRLAACFMESLSTLGCPAYGYGIRYEHGLFRQRFANGRQIEEPEDWLAQPYPWELERTGAVLEIGTGGHVHAKGERGVWSPSETVVARPYDIPVIGWRGSWINTLRLWAAEPPKIFDLERFNHGDYRGAAWPEADARTISRVLYPDDSTDAGKRLRLKQEYLFTSASLRDILRRFEREHGDLRQLPRHVAIQLNDTHPAIAGPELVRLLLDERGLPFDEAEAVARATLSYTNHTLLPEALERWPEDLFRSLLPRHLQLIDRIEKSHWKQYPSAHVRIVESGEVKMGELSFVMAHRVNGVSALHTGLMKETVFANLHKLHPGRIVNQTNGVTPRRWLHACNPGLSGLLNETIGDGWIGDAEQLAMAEPHLEDPGFLDRFSSVKRANKVALSNWLGETTGIMPSPDAMFDVQIKRIHEYKRQHLNILETIALWQEIRAGRIRPETPRVKIFGGKAAPGYVFAKEIIALINAVAARVNADPETKDLLQVIYPANYNVSVAERLIPGSDLSEQISTAGKEASGTGNMKFALNGALTIGTLDGANVEIRERVGAENFFLFGMTAEEVDDRRKIANHAGKAIDSDARLSRALAVLRDETFSPGQPGLFSSVADNISGPDYFLVASDFSDYWRAQREVEAAFANATDWARMAALNTVRSGWFSSDRTIRGYMTDIWGAESTFDVPKSAAE